MAWSFKIDKPGRFTVSADVATPARSSKFEIVVGDQTLPAEVTGTGSYQAFKTVRLGTIEIAEGPRELVVKPLREGWQAINLRSLVLRPAN